MVLRLGCSGRNACAPAPLQHLDEAPDVGVVERRVDLVDRQKGLGGSLNSANIRAIAVRAFSPPESSCTVLQALARRLRDDVDARLELIGLVDQDEPRAPPPKSVVKVFWKCSLMAAKASWKRSFVVFSMRLMASPVAAIRIDEVLALDPSGTRGAIPARRTARSPSMLTGRAGRSSPGAAPHLLGRRGNSARRRRSCPGASTAPTWAHRRPRDPPQARARRPPRARLERSRLLHPLHLGGDLVERGLRGLEARIGRCVRSDSAVTRVTSSCPTSARTVSSARRASRIA